MQFFFQVMYDCKTALVYGSVLLSGIVRISSSKPVSSVAERLNGIMICNTIDCVVCIESKIKGENERKITEGGEEKTERATRVRVKMKLEKKRRKVV